MAIVEYRHSQWAPFPAQIIDAKWARKFMCDHGDDPFWNDEILGLIDEFIGSCVE